MSNKLPPNKALLPTPEEIEDPMNRLELFKPVRTYLSRLNVALTRAFADRLSKTEPVPSLLMLSPDGSVWQVSISNTGVLTPVKIYG